MANFIEYKGFKIEPIESGFSLWGASLFEPLDISYAYAKKLDEIKRAARHFLKSHKLTSWPVLFSDRIVKY